jgi:hypothetical protein
MGEAVFRVNIVVAGDVVNELPESGWSRLFLHYNRHQVRHLRWPGAYAIGSSPHARSAPIPSRSTNRKWSKATVTAHGGDRDHPCQEHL